MNSHYLVMLLCIPSAIIANFPRVANLSLDEKLGQLLMVATIADPDNPISKDVLFGRSTKNIPSIKLEKELTELIEKYHNGGVLFLGKSSSEKQWTMTKRLIACNEHHSKIPLLFGLDAEWGPEMRITDATKFPFNIALGAIRDKKLLKEFGFMIGSMLKALHIGINFAPVADCNTNFLNPVINRRSFGENPEAVSECDQVVIEGLQEAGVGACVKHYPGHGDTEINTHNGLAIIKHSRDRLLKVELVPFKAAVAKHVKAIMSGHLLVPALDPQLPATLSPAIMTDTIRKNLSFDGILATDALDMEAITKMYTPAESVLLALKAGNDLVVAPIEVPQAIARIKKAIETGEITIEELDKHVQRILDLKEWIASRNDETKINASITEILNSKEAQDLSKKLFQKAITLVRNKNVLPITPGQPLSIVAIGADTVPAFSTFMQQTNASTVYLLPTASTADDYETTTRSLSATIVIAVFGLKYGKAPFGITSEAQAFIEKICKEQSNVTIVLFGNPYAASLFSYAPALIEGYEDHPYAQEAAAKVIVGEFKPDGTLPVTASPEIPVGTSLTY